MTDDDMYLLFKESFIGDLRKWKTYDYEKLDIQAQEIFYDERNWNNGDVGSGQFCWSEEEIYAFLERYKND